MMRQNLKEYSDLYNYQRMLEIRTDSTTFVLVRVVLTGMTFCLAEAHDLDGEVFIFSSQPSWMNALEVVFDGAPSRFQHFFNPHSVYEIDPEIRSEVEDAFLISARSSGNWEAFCQISGRTSQRHDMKEPRSPLPTADFNYQWYVDSEERSWITAGGQVSTHGLRYLVGIAFRSLLEKNRRNMLWDFSMVFRMEPSIPELTDLDDTYDAEGGKIFVVWDSSHLFPKHFKCIESFSSRDEAVKAYDSYVQRKRR